MINSVGLQYATALFDLAEENKSVNDYYQALCIINEVILEEEIKKTFEHPSISLEDKKMILKESLENSIDELLLNFLYVLIDNNRLNDLGLIVEAYKELLNEYENNIEVNVYSKYSLTEEQRVDITKKLSFHYQKNIILHEYLDESLLGGIKITCDGKIIDTSALHSLDSLKNSLKKGW